MPFIGNRVTLIDYARPIAKRTRKVTGPYYFNVCAPVSDQGRRGFYMGKHFEMDRAGSMFRMRCEDANENLPQYSRTRDITGYYCDDFQDDTLQPIILRLSRSRGFLAGWTMGQGMASTVDCSHIWDNIEDCARAAHRLAEYDAEEERRYQEEQRQQDIEDENNPTCGIRGEPLPGAPDYDDYPCQR